MFRNLTISLVEILAIGGMLASAQLVRGQEIQGRPVKVVEGLDGANYLAYRPALVKRVQEKLKAEGLYDGDVTAKLDQPTKEALAEFQKRHGLDPSGVPTPRTRKLLLSNDKPPPTT